MSIKDYRYIAFEGPMATEKSRLVRLVAQVLSAEMVFDLKQNPFLEAFYKNKQGAAFQAQIFFLLNRHQILQELAQPNLFQQLKISDFVLQKDRIYAYQNLTDSELMLYEKLYSMLAAELVKPDLVVYLQMSSERILENLKKRRGSSLYTISEAYVESLVEGYNRFFFHYQETPLIIMNVNEVQFERDRGALDDLLNLFRQKHRGVTYFSPSTA